MIDRGWSDRFFRAFSLFLIATISSNMTRRDKAISGDSAMFRFYFIRHHLFFDQIIFEANKFHIICYFLLIFTWTERDIVDADFFDFIIES